MKLRPILITNNPKAYAYCQSKLDCVFLEHEDYIQVLYQARDQVHLGHKLLSHPLAGSLKPNQTPYKSVILEGEKSQANETMESVMLMENTIEAALKFFKNNKLPDWPDRIRKDFQTVDLSFITHYVDKLVE